MGTIRATARRQGGLLALWFLAGAAAVFSLLALLSIGIFVAPFAVGLLALALVLTTRRPHEWPAVAGLGFAAAAGLVWLGLTLGTGSPADLSCSSGPEGEVCRSGGRLVDPDAFRWTDAGPWVVAGAAVAVLTCAAYVVANRLSRSHQGLGS